MAKLEEQLQEEYGAYVNGMQLAELLWLYADLPTSLADVAQVSGCKNSKALSQHPWRRAAFFFIEGLDQSFWCQAERKPRRQPARALAEKKKPAKPAGSLAEKKQRVECPIYDAFDWNMPMMTTIIAAFALVGYAVLAGLYTGFFRCRDCCNCSCGTTSMGEVQSKDSEKIETIENAA
eukprot:s5152_g1.t1